MKSTPYSITLSHQITGQQNPPGQPSTPLSQPYSLPAQQFYVTGPEFTLDAVRSGTPEATARAAQARKTVERFPMPAALKTVLSLR